MTYNWLLNLSPKNVISTTFVTSNWVSWTLIIMMFLQNKIIWIKTKRILKSVKTLPDQMQQSRKERRIAQILTLVWSPQISCICTLVTSRALSLLKFDSAQMFRKCQHSCTLSQLDRSLTARYRVTFPTDTEECIRMIQRTVSVWNACKRLKRSDTSLIFALTILPIQTHKGQET